MSLVLSASESLRAGAHEILVVTLDQPVRFGVEAEFCAIVVERLDALEERAVQIDRVLLRGKFRRHLGLDFLQGGIRVRAREIGKNAVDPSEQLAGFFQRDDRVFEGRRLGVGRDRFDLLQLLGHSLFIGRRKMFVLDLVEGRVMEIERTFFEERIFSHRCRAG